MNFQQAYVNGSAICDSRDVGACNMCDQEMTSRPQLVAERHKGKCGTNVAHEKLITSRLLHAKLPPFNF